MDLNGSASGNLDDYQQIFSSCIKSVWSLLFLHFFYKWLVTMCIFYYPVMLTVQTGRYLRIRYRYEDPSFSAWLLIQTHYSRDDGLRQCLLHELQLISGYIYLAMAFSLTIGNQSLHWITIFRWTIEASNAPYTCFMVVLSMYHGCWNGLYFFENDPRVSSLTTFIVKGIVFVWMRYTELYHSSALNDYQTLVYYVYCGTFDYDHVPVGHRYYRFLKNVY